MIVQISVVANGRFVLLVLDDGSGENIEVKIERLPMEQASINRDRNGNTSSYVPQFGIGNIVHYSSRTTVANLIVPAITFTNSITIDSKLASIGTIILAGGSVVTFRDSRQIMLAQIGIIDNTETEIHYWSQVATWKRTKLARPWILTAQQREDHDAKLRRDLGKAEAKRCKAQKRQRHLERKQQEDERHAEEERRKEEMQMNEGAMYGSDHIRQPWDRDIVPMAPALDDLDDLSESSNSISSQDSL
jgi:hypothetical protein